MQGRVHVRGQQAVAGDDRLLGGGGPAGQPEPRGDLALVELRALGQPRLLGVLGDDPVECLDVLQGPPHQQRVGDAEAVVGEDADPGSGVGHGAELGQLLAGSPTVTAPTGRTSTYPACSPSRQTCSTTPAVSATGSVLAIACTAV